MKKSILFLVVILLFTACKKDDEPQDREFPIISYENKLPPIAGNGYGWIGLDAVENYSSDYYYYLDFKVVTQVISNDLYYTHNYGLIYINIESEIKKDYPVSWSSDFVVNDSHIRISNTLERERGKDSIKLSEHPVFGNKPVYQIKKASNPEEKDTLIINNYRFVTNEINP